jgi:hypothetical protein
MRRTALFLLAASALLLGNGCSGTPADGNGYNYPDGSVKAPPAPPTPTTQKPVIPPAAKNVPPPSGY